MEWHTAVSVLFAVEIFVRLQAGIVGITKLTGLLVGWRISGFQSLTTERIGIEGHKFLIS